MQSVRFLLCASLGFHDLEVLGATFDPPDFFSVGREAFLPGYDPAVRPVGWVNLRKIVAVDMTTGSIELFFFFCGSNGSISACCSTERSCSVTRGMIIVVSHCIMRKF